MAKIKWSEQDVIDAFQRAVEEAASMQSPQEMMQQLMMEAQSEENQPNDFTS